MSAAASRLLELERREPSLVEAPADPDLVPPARGAHVLHAGPVREVGPEVRDDVVLLLGGRACSARQTGPVERDVPVLDPQRARARRCRTPRCHRRQRRLGRWSPGTGPTSTPLFVFSPAFSASVTSGVTPAPITTKSHSISRPDLVTTAGRGLPLEALQLLPAMTFTPCRPACCWKKPPDLGAAHALERHVLEHHDLALLPSAVNDAASSVPM